MEEYTFSRDLERAISGRVRKGNRFYKFFLVLFVLSGILSIVMLLINAHGWCIGSAFIAGLSVVCMFACGREVLFARNNETIVITQKSIKEYYAPKFFTDNKYNAIENEMDFSEITDIIHNAKNCRYEIKGEYLYREISDISGCKEIVKEIKKSGPLYIYEYFVEIENIIAQVANNTKLKIKER